ncbi:hypothetical protein DFH08DRAFT_803961 [Mycena albidolilacea]|uniref:Uncharacterized protein n=1 Tax=Mycena albidolilacea TaxID=1033008 RepID=A0AAD7EX30_9AGAR|nr:hypothetical protein DFH08DRAFT_803961 [Mycena albidolilacea]
MDELNALPYLDSVVHETLRLMRCREILRNVRGTMRFHEDTSAGQMRSQAPGAEARDVRLSESADGEAAHGSAADECVAQMRTRRLAVGKGVRAAAMCGRRVARTMPRVASMRWRRSMAATAASDDSAHVREVEGVASTPGAACGRGTEGKTGNVGDAGSVTARACIRHQYRSWKGGGRVDAMQREDEVSLVRLKRGTETFQGPTGIEGAGDGAWATAHWGMSHIQEVPGILRERGAGGGSKRRGRESGGNDEETPRRSKELDAVEYRHTMCGARYGPALSSDTPAVWVLVSGNALDWGSCRASGSNGDAIRQGEKDFRGWEAGMRNRRGRTYTEAGWVESYVRRIAIGHAREGGIAGAEAGGAGGRRATGGAGAASRRRWWREKAWRQWWAQRTRSMMPVHSRLIRALWSERKGMGSLKFASAVTVVNYPVSDSTGIKFDVCGGIPSVFQKGYTLGTRPLYDNAPKEHKPGKGGWLYLIQLLR